MATFKNSSSISLMTPWVILDLRNHMGPSGNLIIGLTCVRTLKTLMSPHVMTVNATKAGHTNQLVLFTPCPYLTLDLTVFPSTSLGHSLQIKALTLSSP